MRSYNWFFTLLVSLILTSTWSACNRIVRDISPSDALPSIQEREISADDVKLHVRMAGNPRSGNALIAVHGGPGMSSDYMISLERLAGPDFAVATYDQRGTGRSSSPAEIASSYTLAKYVADLEAVRKAVGVDQVHVLGHSWGGVVAMSYAAAHPEHVRSLVLVSSGPPDTEAKDAGQERMRQRIVTLQRQGVIPETLSSLADLLPAYYSDPRFEPPQELRDLHFSPVPERLTWAAVGDYDLTAEVSALKHDVLLLWGQDDPFGLLMAEATQRALSSAQVEFVVLEGCGHFWQECPETFLTRLQTFLGLPAPTHPDGVSPHSNGA
jgi:pimeloyl-ACP methyl ester carboxylesterase